MKYCETCGHYEVCKYKADYIANCPDYITPVRHGKWIDAGKSVSSCKCTACNAVCEDETKYCPYCGAKMDGD